MSFFTTLVVSIEKSMYPHGLEHMRPCGSELNRFAMIHNVGFTGWAMLLLGWALLVVPLLTLMLVVAISVSGRRR